MTFSQDDIRPEIFTDDKLQALHKDLERLRLHQSAFVEVNCPACGSSSKHFVFEKYGFQFVECILCETVYMSPRATPEILREFYAHSVLYDYWNKHIFPASQQVRREKIFKPRVERILDICTRHTIETHCLVEVGAGFGTFCDEVNNTGKFKRVIAIEPSSSLAESCRAAGLEVIENTIENITQLDTAIDVITAFEVIEHLFSPQDFLMHCKRLLASNGLIVVSCPNFKGFDISLLAPKSDSLDAEHINLFNPDSLDLLFTHCGFEVLERTTPGELDAEIVRDKVISGEYSLEGQPFLKTVLIDRWDELGKPFQAFLKQHELSSHLWLVARKVKD